jgi:putative ABC transport system permease protein
MTLKVTGVMEDMPSNSHFKADMLCSFNSWKDYVHEKNWWNNSNQTYIQLRKGTDVESFEAKLPDFIRRHLFESENQYKEFTTAENMWQYKLQPLTRIHLTSHLNGEFEPNGDIGYVYIFSVAAVFILIIACINFMNLTTAKSAIRFREIGIRKVSGATRKHLILQFLSESLVITFISGLLALALIYIALPWFNQLAGKQYSLPFAESGFMLMLAALLLLTGLVAGSYPSLYLSSLNPSKVLKSAFDHDARGMNFRSVLVVTQFIISAFLIAGTFGVYNQLKYLSDIHLGYDKENIAVLKRLNYMDASKIEAFKQELSESPLIRSTSLSNTVPMWGLPNWGCKPETESEQSITLNSIVCDHDFADVYKLEIAEGRFFSSDFPTDSLGIVINEQTQKLLGWKEPLGRKINFGGDIEYHVIGVVKDFHYEPLYQAIRPGALFIRAPWGSDMGLMSVRISPDNTKEAIRQLEKTWKKFSTLSMEFSFFDQDYDKVYKNEQRTGKIMTAFSLLAVIIACLGLFGLSAFITEQKTKEIGIRKVHGAGIMNLVLMLSFRFLRWVMIACFIAIPVSILTLSGWLSHFAYRIPIRIYPYLLTLLIVLSIALVTVIVLVVRKALTNPVHALRYE